MPANTSPTAAAPGSWKLRSSAASSPAMASRSRSTNISRRKAFTARSRLPQPSPWICETSPSAARVVRNGKQTRICSAPRWQTVRSATS